MTDVELIPLSDDFGSPKRLPTYPVVFVPNAVATVEDSGKRKRYLISARIDGRNGVFVINSKIADGITADAVGKTLTVKDGVVYAVNRS